MADGDRGKRRERGRGSAERSERKRGAAASEGSRGRRAKRTAEREGHLPLERSNLILFAVALGVIVLGFVILARGSITLAPLLLVLGYCVLVPVAIVYRSRRRAGPRGAESDSRANSSAG